MDRNSTPRSRFEILKTVYRQCNGQSGKTTLLHPRQIEDAFFTDVQFDLRILKEKGLVEFKGNFATHRFQVSLTPAGAALVAQAYHAIKTDPAERDVLLDSLFAQLKV